MAIALSGSLVITGSIFATEGITGSFSGNATSASFASTLQGLGSASFAPAATFNTVSQSYATASGSLSTRVTNLESTSSVLTSASSSFAIVSSSYATASGSLSTRVTNLESTSSTVSSSFATTSGSIAGRVTLIEGQDATTGSNVFTGVQYISEASNAISFTSTASLYTDGGLRVTKDSFISGTAYFNNVVVYGTSSIQYITSSQVNFGTNIITVNTDTPAVRFGGLAVFDSGSTQLTGSMLWDSEKNHWVYANPSGSTYSGGMIMSGPRASSLGNEQGTTACALMMGQGGDHITSSAILHYSNATCFYGQSFISSSGAACFSGQVCSNTVSTTDGTNVSQLANNYLRSTAGNFYFDACAVGASFNFRTSNASALDSTAMFICGTNSRVGIGTTVLCSNGLSIRSTSDDYSLAILQQNTNTAGYGFFAGNSGDFSIARLSGGAYTSAALKIQLNTNVVCFASTVCSPMVLASGCIGIGATSPSDLLDIYASSGTAAIRLSGAGAGTNTYRITGQLIGVSNTGFGIYDSTNSTYRLAIDGSGNVGIGTASPTQKLTLINGTFQIGGSSTFSDNVEIGRVGGDNNMAFATGGSERMRITSTGIACFACQVCAPSFRTSGNVEVISTSAYVLVGEGVGVNEYGAIDWDATNNRLQIATQPYAFGANGGQITLTTGGNVGIGTTSPSAKLTLEGSANNVNSEVRIIATGVASGYLGSNSNGFNIGTDTGGIVFKTDVIGGSSVGNTGTERMRINSSGNVLINCSRHEYGQLQVSTIPSTAGAYASALGLGFLANACEGASTGISFYTKISLGGAVWENARIATFTDAVSSSAYGALAFYTMNATTLSERMRIGNNGYIGIGTSSPGTTLEVYPGSISSDACQEIIRLDVPGANIFSAAQGYINFRGYDISNNRQRDIAWIGAQLVPDLGAACQFGGNLVFRTTNTGASQTPQERMRITSAGKVGIGTTDLSTEANLFLGAQGAIEGGQLVLQKGTSCSCATHLDNYQDSFRVLSGTNTGSTAVNMTIDHRTSNACFNGSIRSTNFITITGGATIGPNATATVLTLSSSISGVYIINANFGIQGNQVYGSTLIVVANGGSFRIVTNGSGSSAALTLSGANVQLTNALGVPLDSTASAILIGNL